MSQPTLAFAHRGWHGNAVENSLAAFDAAYAEGCDGVEFDVQFTADKIPVIFHDDDLQRLAGRSEVIHEMKWRDLCRLELFQNQKRATIPTLDDFLSQHGHKPFYLEVKVPNAMQINVGYCDSLAQCCYEKVLSARPHAQTFLASFHVPLMKSLRAHRSLHHPFIPLGIIYEDEAVFNRILAESLSGFSQPWLHSLENRIWQQCVLNKHPLPPPQNIWLWGLQNSTEMQQAFQAGLGGLVVDDVPALLQVMGRA